MKDTIKGPYGIAHRFDIEDMFNKIGKRDNTLCMWAVNVPWANCMWEWYMIRMQDLKQIPGLPKLIISRPGASHEVGIAAMSPEFKFAARTNPSRHILHPWNFVAQYNRPDDIAAVAEIEVCIEDIVNGLIAPETDYTQHWIRRFGSSNIKGDPKTAGQQIVAMEGRPPIVIAPKPLDSIPKDHLCRFCGMPAVATAIMGDEVCIRCSTNPGYDMKKGLLWKMLNNQS